MQWLATLAFSAILVPCFPCAAQLVEVGPPGPPDPHYCEEVDPIKPNLVLAIATRLNGTLRDQTGAPFGKSKVELSIYRSAEKQEHFKTVFTDETGYFDLGQVPKGSYRLIGSPTRAFYQPDPQGCPGSGTCSLEITLIVHPTDMPDSPCPVK
jgi:hypothetical protein